MVDGKKDNCFSKNKVFLFKMMEIGNKWMNKTMKIALIWLIEQNIISIIIVVIEKILLTIKNPEQNINWY